MSRKEAKDKNRQKRWEAFFEERKKEGPMSLGLSCAHKRAGTLESACELVVPLITKATRENSLYTLMRDLQLIKKDKLLSMNKGVYLVALQEASASGLVQ